MREIRSTFRSGVMAGLVPAIHVLRAEPQKKVVDARDKRGHDGGEVIRSHQNALCLMRK